MAMGILLIAIDQCIKVAVKLHMGLGEQIVVFDWFRIDFIENRGMAFGMEIGSKLLLSLFRIVAVGFIIWYIGKKIRQGRPLGFILILTMICAGAAGNIFDSLFYGLIFTESAPYGEPAQLVAWGEGYAPMLMGRVVDMFYFPLFQWNSVPGFLDFLVDSRNYFFGAVFNLADAYISVAVVYLLIFHYKYFNK